LTKTVYVAIGVDLEGNKDILGLWVAKTEGSKFWLSIMTELKNRGVEDILIACCDGLTGLPDAIAAVFFQTTVQLCIVHMIRNSLKYVAWRDYKAITRDLKLIYTAPTEAAAKDALTAFKSAWHNQYPTITPMWERHWENIVPFLAYPKEIRRVIYTTNAIEAVNRQIRKVIKTKGSFPSDDSALKLIYLALKNAKLSSIMPPRDWKQALAQFAILFHDRLPT
jgi:transposase-like protein